MKHPSLYIASSLAGGILLADLTISQAHFGARTWMLLGACVSRERRLACAPRKAMAHVGSGDGSVDVSWWRCFHSGTNRCAFGPRHVADSTGPHRDKSAAALDGPICGRIPCVCRGDFATTWNSNKWKWPAIPFPFAADLQVQYFREPDSDAPPNVRAGDRVEALVKAGLPHNYANPGGFDYRRYLERQGIELTGSLRSGDLLQLQGLPAGAGGPALRVSDRIARIRGRLLDTVDAMLAGSPGRAAVARAMLLGDRSFVDHERVEAYQKTGVYHVLVIAGLHVAALAAFLFWIGRRLRLRLIASVILTVAALGAFVLIVEDRPPILRAALMAAIYLFARVWFRRVSLINTVALAALVILAFRPSEISDPTFLLSFLAAGTIAALAVPWMEHSSEPYLRALEHLDDASRDAAHVAKAKPTQLRLDLRAASRWLASKWPRTSRRARAKLSRFPFAWRFGCGK